MHATPKRLPSPAIIAQDAVRRLPRWALWGLCLVFILAGFIGRDPWRVDDAHAYMLMQSLVTQWLDADLAWSSADLHISHVLGALSIKLVATLSWGLIPEPLSARLPFMAMLGLTLVSTWEATYYLARRDAAQPVPFAFGGEAKPTDYARTIADGALLALVATLGLARIGHEASPAMWQLCMVSLLFFALSANRYHPMRALIALTISVTGLLIAHWQQVPLKNAVTWNGALAFDLSHLLVWFAYPTWILSAVALYKWRRHWLCAHPATHIALPLGFVAVHLAVLPFAMRADRWLLSALPALATLAAFGLPTLGRSLKSLIDFLSLSLFSVGALVIWVVWVSLQTGIPAQPALNVLRLQPSYVHAFSMPLLLLGLAITLAWGKLVVWRLGRHPSAIWMSLVLPAAGWVMCWSLLMTLWLPLLNHARRAVLP